MNKKRNVRICFLCEEKFKTSKNINFCCKNCEFIYEKKQAVTKKNNIIKRCEE